MIRLDLRCTKRPKNHAIGTWIEIGFVWNNLSNKYDDIPCSPCWQITDQIKMKVSGNKDEIAQRISRDNMVQIQLSNILANDSKLVAVRLLYFECLICVPSPLGKISVSSCFTCIFLFWKYTGRNYVCITLAAYSSHTSSGSQNVDETTPSKDTVLYHCIWV